MSNAAVNPFFGNILDSTEEVWDKVTCSPNDDLPPSFYGKVEFDFVSFVFCPVTDLVCKCEVSLPHDKVGGASHVKEGVSDRLQHSSTI